MVPMSLDANQTVLKPCPLRIPSLPRSLPLFAFMCWPDNARKQADLLGLDHLDRRNAFDSSTLLQRNSILRTELRLALEDLGGADMLHLSRSRSEIVSDLQRRVELGELAGVTLCVMYLLQTDHAKELRHDPTLRRIWKALPQSAKYTRLDCPSVYWLERAWKAFKPVAHFWAAWFFLERWLTPRPNISPYHLDAEPSSDATYRPLLERASDTLRMMSMLSLAKEIQAFGTSFKAMRAKSELLPFSEIWSLDEIPDWEFTRPTGVLSKRFLSILDQS